jgi:DNA-directed RNA polymerase specialized sigma24 family protein
MNITSKHVRKQPKGQQASAALSHLQAAFTAKVMPAVEQHARIYFRHVKCSERKADLVAEALGLAWRWFRRLAERGKDGTTFPTVIATFAARAVNSGRRVCGQEKTKDVLSPRAQRQKGFAVEKLPDFSTLSNNPLQEALIDNTLSPVPEQAAFRIDLPCWLEQLGSRRRDIVIDMALGSRTQELGQKYKVSEGRISQMRREAAEDWNRFHGDAA